MLHRSFKPVKCKTALKLAISRIKLMKNKKDNHLKQLKRELAQLLESGQDQTARIRVEHVVREEKTIAAYELIDIYCELIVARLPIIESQKNCPIDLKEAVTSVVFAAPRCADIPELQDIRKHFVAKYGKEFINAALEMRPDCGVSRMLVEKLSVNAPDGQMKIKILSAIAEEHNVVWDPKSFGEKESKPYDDLLKGPNTFDNASEMHQYPPVVQAPPPPPNVHAPQGREKKHNAPINNQQSSHSSNSNNFASSHLTGGQSTGSTTPYRPVEPSGTQYEGTDIRHSHSRDGNSFSLSGQNWTMQFKDATAAAQAAADSAERASVAARAAARFAMNEHPHEKSRISTTSPSEKIVKNSEDNDNPPKDRNQENRYQQETHYDANEKFYSDDQSSAKRYSQTASISGRPSVSVDDKRPANNFDEVNRYSQKNSFKEEAVNLQSSGKDGNNFSGSSSSNDGDNFVLDNNNDLSDSGKSHRETVINNDIYTAGAIFDSYISDDDIIKFEKQPQYDELESDFYSTSVTGKPSNDSVGYIDKGSSLEKTSGLSKKPLSTSRISVELFSPPKFDETSPKAPNSAQDDDMVPAAFDNSSGSGSESDDEIDKSSFCGKSAVGNRSYKENDVFRNSNIHKEHGLATSYFTGKNDSEFTRKKSSVSSSDDREYIEVGDNELKFLTLAGGLRNKGYRTPPYRKTPTGNALSLKEEAENSSTYTQNVSTSSRVESSLNSIESAKLKEGSNSEIQLKNYDSVMDGFEEELARTKSANKEERKEEYTKPKFSVPAGFFYPDESDSEEDLPKKSISSKVRAKSGSSRRTKANAGSENTSYAKSKRGSVRPVKPISVSENKSDISENMPKEKLKPSTMEQPSTESSIKKASHVHPKLPDIDTLTAHLQSLRQNRG